MVSIKTARTLRVDMLYDGVALMLSIENSHLEREKLCLSGIKAFGDRWGIKMGSFCVSKNVDYTNLHSVGGQIAQIFEYKFACVFCFFFKQLTVITKIKTCTVFLVLSMETSRINTGYINLIILWIRWCQWMNTFWYCEKEKKKTKNIFAIRYNTVC